MPVSTYHPACSVAEFAAGWRPRITTTASRIQDTFLILFFLPIVVLRIRDFSLIVLLLLGIVHKCCQTVRYLMYYLLKLE